MFSREAMFTTDEVVDNKANDNSVDANNEMINSINGNDISDEGVDSQQRYHECDNRVHRSCLQVKYTEEEVENVRLYLQKRFTKTKPVRPVCERLYVRKDVKCLTHKELSELIDAFRILYRTGVMDRYSLIHAAYWPATHKFAEGIPWHRWHVLQIEKKLRKINPKLTMPYWESYSEFSAPERSSIWDFLGTSGRRDNDYCITDGAFAYQTVRYPHPHCISRQWNRNGSISPWEAPEWLTSATQRATTWDQYVQMIGFTGHFKLHLSIGGYYGDYSVPFATNDPLFYIFHAFPTDLALLKWQLSDDNYLVPQSYTGANRLDTRTQRIVRSNIERDMLAYYTKTRVKEAFQVGFGDLCYIHDQLIRPINDIMNNIKRDAPVAMQRLVNTLSPELFQQYFPKYAAQNATAFDNFLPDVGHCPPPDKCRPIPIALRYNATPNGLRQLERFRFDANLDTTPLTFQAETAYYGFMNELRTHQYCSPYAT